MKLITLNTWGGRVKDPLHNFLKSYSGDIDIFCLQEVYHNGIEEEVEGGENINLFNEIKKILPQYQGYFHPTHDDDFGLVTFLSKDITVHDSGSFSLYDGMQLSPKDENKDRIAQWFSVTHDAQNYMILNMHGYHTKTGKGDIPERLIQSQNIIKHAEKFINNDIPVIVCGDFNLRPDTESIAMFNTYFKNLINMYNVQNTRTSYYTRDEKFADYIFISDDLHEKEFKCMDEEVSDHAALYVEV